MSNKMLAVVMAGISLCVISAVAQTSGTFTDPRDGKTYRITTIGNQAMAEKWESQVVNQTWMAENLNFQIGTSWCYDNNNANCNKYGRLYDWNTAMRACPAGWRLPTNAEWSTLVSVVGNGRLNPTEYGKYNTEPHLTAGKKLKSKTGWAYSNLHNGNGTDEYGFSALPGGNRGSTDYRRWPAAFYNPNYGKWWSATEDKLHEDHGGGVGAWTRVMDVHEYVASFVRDKRDGYSVRCLRDAISSDDGKDATGVGYGAGYGGGSSLDLKKRDETPLQQQVGDSQTAEEANNNGAMAYMNNDYDKAIEEFTKAIRLRPNDAPPYRNRGMAHYKKKDYENAIADFNKAIQLDKKFADVYYDRGIAYYEKKDWDNAVTDFRKAMQLNPVAVLNTRIYASAYNNRGVSYYKKGLHQKAIDDFERALKLDPNSEAKNNLANVRANLRMQQNRR